MKVYVASAFINKDLVSSWMDKLREHGIQITEDWTQQAPGPGVRSDLDLSVPEQKRLAQLDLEGVRTADVMWLIAPEPGLGAGCFVEMGYALALSKDGVGLVVSGPRCNIFTSLSFAYFEQHEQAFTEILRLMKMRERATCSSCKGSGRQLITGLPCTACPGNGIVVSGEV